MDHLGAALELKSVDISQRIISGYAAVAGNLDKVGDIIDPAAFTKTLAEKAPGDVAVFIGHQTNMLPVGIPLVLQADGKGLYSETLIKGGPVGDDLLETAAFLQRHGRSLGMSIGYRTRNSKMERVGGKMVRVLTDVDVMEYSFAASQSIANPQALVVGVKAGKQASELHVEQRADGWHVIDEDDGDDLGTFDSEAEAQTAIAALVNEENEPEDDADMPMMDEAARRQPMKTLPDDAFLYIQAGGVLDDEGLTTPRGLRQLPYRDAEGKLDTAALQRAVAVLRTAPPPELDVQGAQQLTGRAHRLLAAALAGQKTLAADAPEWQQGAVPQLAYVGYTLVDVADALAESHKAMALLGEDTKAGARMQSPMRAKLREAIQTLTDIVNWAETVDAEKDAVAKVALYRRQMELQQLDLVAS